MGPCGDTLVKRVIKPEDNVWERAVKYAELPLDFQPGTASGYSAMAGFEVLAAIVEKVSGEAYDRYLDKHIFEPSWNKKIIIDIDHPWNRGKECQGFMSTHREH